MPCDPLDLRPACGPERSKGFGTLGFGSSGLSFSDSRGSGFGSWVSVDFEV